MAMRWSPCALIRVEPIWLWPELMSGKNLVNSLNKLIFKFLFIYLFQSCFCFIFSYIGFSQLGSSKRYNWINVAFYHKYVIVNIFFISLKDLKFS
jgi:hypothetical protein